MKKALKIVATTCVVGFGMSFGLSIITTVHGLLGEANPRLCDQLEKSSLIIGVIAALIWAIRRVRRRPVKVAEWVMFWFAAVWLSYYCYLYVSNETDQFLAFNPIVAAQRFAGKSGVKLDTQDKLVFCGTTSIGVRVYAVEKDGKRKWLIGVAPRFNKLWWTKAFVTDPWDYEHYGGDQIMPPQK